ncbi:MAG: Phosphate regulon transcriptional regulatory protein PhoB (SphR) [Myxococcaceae bacterium]|nr:Phosphate regulon transcriptional regulatory protein PhoB (SphR) [Myxococcaceae bacterium]
MKNPAPVARSTASNDARQTPQRQQILIVDADESSRSVLAVALGREGFEAVAVSSAAEAMRLLGPGLAQPEMMVVANDLPDEDGFSFVAQLRADHHTGAIPVLLLAKGDEGQLRQRSRAVGVDEIILKPVYARDVATLARVQLCPLGTDGGRILDCATAPVPHLLRALLATARSGVIELEQGRGHIAYRRGKVLDANFDGLHGLNGLIRSLALARGPYKLINRNLAFDPTFHCTLKELSNVVFPRLQRWEELTVRSLPLDARLGLDFAALARALPSMPDAVNGVVRLFDGLRDVRQVLMDSPLDETVSLEIATRLYLMGVVVPPKDDGLTGIARADPRLFEPKATEAVERMDQLFSTNPTPIQVLAETSAADEDWEHDVQGTGLELTSDPSEGWSTTRSVDLYGSRDLADEVQQQLNAFNIQPVVEHEGAPLFATDLLEFTAGEAAADQPMETALTAPIQLVQLAPLEAPPAAAAPVVVAASVHTLEHEFFNIEETPAPAVEAPRASVSQAVLGFSIEEDELEEQEAAVEPARIGALGWMVVVGLLVAAAAVTAWQLASNSEPAPVGPVVAAVAAAAPSEAQPIHLAPAVQVEPAIAAPVQVDPSSALVAATRLYDEGKLTEAKRALEELVGQESSNTNAWMLLGLARFDSDDIPGAEEAANTVLAIDPKVARAYLLRATILIAARQRTEASAEIQKYLDLEPNGPFAAEAKALLKR